METYDSFQNRYGWYRATLHADKAGPVYAALRRPVGDVRPVSERPARHDDHADLRPIRLALTFPNAQPGDNTLAILVKASPRSKVLFYRSRRHADGARIVGRRLRRFAASTSLVDVSWKKWDKATRGR